MKLAAATVMLSVGLAAQAFGHGTTLSPASRAYVCRYIDRDSAPCARAWEKDPQALYDWMGVLISDADGRHRKLIPDGELCSAGDPKFGAFDRPSRKWLATDVEPGRQTWRWVLNAPHATRYYRFYMTRPGYDPTKPLRWSDLELIHDSGPRDAAAIERFRVDVPERTGRHVVYSIWQRSDSPEAFYSCSDVDFGGKGTLPDDPPLPDEGLNQPPGGTDDGVSPPAGRPTRKGIRFKLGIDDDWGSGYCATVTVRNVSKRRRTWKGSLPFTDEITGLWNAIHRVQAGRLHARGESFNATLAPKASTTFGFCANRR